MAQTRTIPEELVLIEQLLNTADCEAGGDDLRTPSDLFAWLRERDLIAPADEVNDADLALVVRTRELLRRLLHSDEGQPGHDRTVDELNAVASELPLHVTFEHDGGATLAGRDRGVRRALARMMADIAVARARGSWARLKVCALDSCQWAFYDSSKNRSGKWCSMRVCGNRNKTRAYRQRRRGD